MRAPISVVIPTLNATQSLPACLASLVEGLERGFIRELIVSDGGSTDETVEIAKAWGGEIVSGAPSRGGQLRRGCAAAQGDWLLVLHADTQLEPGWSEPVAVHLQTGRPAYFRLRFDRGGRFVAAWANLRAGLGLPYGDQGVLVPKALYEQIGGYRDIPLMEDVALVRELAGQLTMLDVTAITSAEKYRRDGWLNRGSRNLWTLARYVAGADPETLAKSYRRVGRR